MAVQIWICTGIKVDSSMTKQTYAIPNVIVTVNISSNLLDDAVIAHGILEFEQSSDKPSCYVTFYIRDPLNYKEWKWGLWEEP